MVAEATSSGEERTKTCLNPSRFSFLRERLSCRAYCATTCGPKFLSGRSLLRS